MIEGQQTTHETPPTQQTLDARAGINDLGELSLDAKVSIEAEDFITGFALLSTAVDDAKTAQVNQRLSPGDATNLGMALLAAGHAHYNYCIDAEGARFSEYMGPKTLDVEGKRKFQQALELFTYSISFEPIDAQTYLGLFEAQRELGQVDSATQTLGQLEALLENNPNIDTTEVRLTLAKNYRLLEDFEQAKNTYAKIAIKIMDKLTQ